MYEILQKQICDAKLEKHMHLVGFQEEISDYLSQLDIFILPSRSEGFPVSLLEALASGLSCIATHVGGIPEMLEDGVVVPLEDPQALADAMLKLLDPTIRDCFARMSSQIVEKYSLDRCVGEFKKVYESLL